MSARKLTTRFMSFDVAQFEKANKCSVVDALDIGNLEVNKLARLIKLGNHNMTEEQAYEKLDDYLYADENNSLISAFLDLVEELDRDLRILKTCGVSVADLKERMFKSIKSRTNDLEEAAGIKEERPTLEVVENE